MLMVPGPLMLDVAGKTLTSEDAELLRSPWVGAVILFTRNFSNPEQLRALTASIREANPSILISVDHEGGRVQRFREGFSKIPAMAVFETLYRESQTTALDLLHETGWLLASELLECGIDFSFAPVLDLNFGRSTVIGDRAFSRDSETVVELAGALIGGMHEAGMVVTGKHFPGHGWVTADSHTDIPVDERSFDDICSSDLVPFKRLAAKGLDAIMPAHIIYSEVDEKPAGFSPYWLQNVLREELQFDGVIFSDDLSMEGAAVAGSYSQRAEQALKAGCDMVLVCNQRQGACEVLDYLDRVKPSPNPRLERLRSRTLGVTVDSCRQQNIVQALARIVRAGDE